MQTALPPDATVIVASRGDDELLDLEGRRGWHFPQEDGVYAGHYPTDSAAAVAHLEALRARGGDFLLFPSTAFWWLDHYAEFAQYLQRQYRLAMYQADTCLIFALSEPAADRQHDLSVAVQSVHYQAVAPRQPGYLSFGCNICGELGAVRAEELSREVSSCRGCGSTPRWRSVIRALSVELFGESLGLPDFPTRRDIVGIGMSDWNGYAISLAQKMNYRNTFYHEEPKLDITHPDPDMEGTLDFIISSEVFEHVGPPVSIAFENARKLLKPSGVLICTVPYGSGKETIEHFPDLHDYRIVEGAGHYVLENVTRDGTRQIYKNLVFHGGAGCTLEMRFFSESSLLQHFGAAGFTNVKIYDQPDFHHGIYWREERSFPMAARMS